MLPHPHLLLFLFATVLFHHYFLFSFFFRFLFFSSLSFTCPLYRFFIFLFLFSVSFSDLHPFLHSLPLSFSTYPPSLLSSFPLFSFSSSSRPLLTPSPPRLPFPYQVGRRWVGVGRQSSGSFRKPVELVTGTSPRSHRLNLGSVKRVRCSALGRRLSVRRPIQEHNLHTHATGVSSLTMRDRGNKPFSLRALRQGRSREILHCEGLRGFVKFRETWLDFGR